MQRFLFCFLLGAVITLCPMNTQLTQIDLSLHFAAEKNSLFAIEHLLRRGYCVNVQDPAGATPLHWAAISGQAQVVKRLFELGADIDAQDYTGATALHVAAWARYPQAVLMLLGCGALVNVVKRTNGRTPLHEAIGSGINNRPCRDVVKILLEYGANVNIADVYGEYPLNSAKRYGEFDIVPLIETVICYNT